MKYLYILFAFSILSSCSQAPVDTIIGGQTQVKKDIVYLASDELEGRDTGTPGEHLAAEYISDRFKKLGIDPAGDEGSYYQYFEFNGTPILGENNQLSIGGEQVDSENYYPLNFSGSASIKASTTVDMGFGIIDSLKQMNDYSDKDVKNKIVLIDISSPDGIHPHSAYMEHHDLRLRAERAQAQGAAAVFFYRADEDTEAPSDKLTENAETITIPVFYFSEKPSLTEVYDIDFKINRPRAKGKNIIAFLDKQSEQTIVVGAHYDHLGHGINGSLHRGESAIHNGADDNASGVAAMLQIALDLKDEDLKKNILFIAFSGEERGLLGSNYFVKNPTIDLNSVDYMLNMDMVGRLDSAKNKLSINGVGTSPSWSFIDSTLIVSGLRAVTTESGTGPSDHMSFYLNDIPVLHFFSGTHSDYHKPSDDEHLINYPGIMSIVDFLEYVIRTVNDEDLSFTKTKGDDKKAAAFKVTLGVVPDYLYEDRGMRIDGVSTDRPGERAGLQKGDIIIGVGSREVKDIYDYMEALGENEKGKSAAVRILRNGEEMTLEATFD